jgi:hypothetical protein
MRFAVVHHAEVLRWLSVLWAVVSFAAQSILGQLLVDASQVGVVGEIIARFEQRRDWFSHLETSSSRVFLGATDGRVHLVTHLEGAARQFCVMQDEHQDLQCQLPRSGIWCWKGVAKRLPWQRQCPQPWI